MAVRRSTPMASPIPAKPAPALKYGLAFKASYAVSNVDFGTSVVPELPNEDVLSKVLTGGSMNENLSFSVPISYSSCLQKDVEMTAVKDTKAIMEELRESDVPAEVILDRERKRQIEIELEEKEKAAERKRRNKELLQGRKRAAETMSFGTMQRLSGRRYEYQPLRLLINGPPIVEKEQLETNGYLAHIKAPSKHRVAGGFTAHTGCMRALFDSRIDLLTY